MGHMVSEDENNEKAPFRRGKARAELGQTDSVQREKTFIKPRSSLLNIRQLQQDSGSLQHRTRLFIKSRKKSAN